MYKVYKESWLKYYKFTISDFICMNITFLLPLISGIITKNNYRSYFGLAMIMCLCFYIYVILNDAYKNIYCRGYFVEATSVLYQVSLIYGWVIFITFLLKTTATYSRLSLTFMYLLTLVLTYSVRSLIKATSKKRLNNNENAKKGVVFTFSDRLDELDNIITTVQNNDCKDYHFNRVVVLDNQPVDGCKIPQLPSKEAAYKYIKRNVVDDVLIFANHYNELIYEIEETCISMGVVVHYVLGERKSKYPKKEIVEEFGQYKIVTSGLNVISARQLLVKRAIDIIGSLVGLLIMAICCLFVAPLIYIKSPGPIFYSQTRVGINGRPFKIYKFRSMYPDAEKRKAELMSRNKMSGLMFKVDNDPRIIPIIGQFIRTTSIDELPQMWNVLKGEMSLVGTRPPTLDEFNEYSFHHKSRLAMKPGITGLWQISGRSEVTSFEDVVALDNQYISEWRMGSDVKILFKTVMVVVGRCGAV
ncbi:sugar transferase [Acetobacterium sp.]|uniref:sugar transferase n=1 Tax=Acetobacterium sp. TaxID=1872094 RepID=UPI0035939C36